MEPKIENLQVVKEVDDVRYEKVLICQDEHTGMLYTNSYKQFPSEISCKNFEKKLEKSKKFPNQFYVSAIAYQTEKVKKLCTNIYRLEIYIPYPDEDLSQEIQNRIKFSKNFSSKELTYLLYNMLYGLAHMTKLGLTHGKLGPEFLAKTTTGYAVMDDPFH